MAETVTTTTKGSQAIGLDVGTSRIVSARKTEAGFQYGSQLNAFLTVPPSKVTEAALKKEGVPHLIEESGIWIHGNESQRFADLLNAEVRRPMTAGFVNPDEPESLKVISEIFKLVTGGNGRGIHNVCFTVAAPPVGSEPSLTWHEATMKQVLSDLGYRSRSINEGLAVVYSELEDCNFTGIGVSCGGGLCNVCFSYLSVPMLSFSVPKAGDFIDASAAAMSGERANRLRILKEEQLHINGHQPTQLLQVISVYYDDMIRTLVNALVEGFRNARNLPKLPRPIPLVLSGGTAQPRGFKERFEKFLGEAHFPLAISEVRLAADPLTATARGALMAALAEM
jgi:hypothetical protein